MQYTEEQLFAELGRLFMSVRTLTTINQALAAKLAELEPQDDEE